MPVYTKETITKYEETVYDVPPGWLTLVINKGTEMANAGKTDGLYEFLDNHNVRRVWIDQNAADEWVAFVMPLNEQFDVVVTDIQINDNPSGQL
jgi:hypothetical protein